MNHFTHIINPVKTGPKSDLYKAQPITFESLRRAQVFAKSTCPNLAVQLFTTQFIEDHAIIPSYFTKTPDLTRSIIDVFGPSCHKKLPLIADILNSVLPFLPNQGYLIYSNVDISVQPYFYTAINDLVNQGHDAIAINRRTIDDQLTTLDMMYATLGKRHVGIDCFVFPNAFLKHFHWENGFIGSGPVGMFFCINMISQSQHFLWLEDAHLTFHLGDDKRWFRRRSIKNIRFYNYEELIKVCDYFLSHFDIHQKKQIEFAIALKEFCNHYLPQTGPDITYMKNPAFRNCLRALSSSSSL